MGDVKVLDMLPIEAGTFYVMDRGYLDFGRLYKQHLRIKRFLGTGENAVKTQIWRAVSTYVLIAIIKKLQFNAPLYTMLQILSVSIFEKTLISYALQPDTTKIISTPSCNKMILFDF